MEIKRRDKKYIEITIEMSKIEKLFRAINAKTDRITSGAMEFASLLEEAWYEAKNDFRQPAHAFDKNHPQHPKAEG